MKNFTIWKELHYIRRVHIIELKLNQNRIKKEKQQNPKAKNLRSIKALMDPTCTAVWQWLPIGQDNQPSFKIDTGKIKNQEKR